MRNQNHRINESYFTDSDSSEIVNDVVAQSIEATDNKENAEVYSNDDADNNIFLSFTLKGTKDMKLLRDNMRKWSRDIFYAIESLGLFYDSEDFFVMIRFPYPNEHHPLYYNYGRITSHRISLSAKNMKSNDACNVFEPMLAELDRDSNKLIYFDLLIGYNKRNNSLKNEYMFWKRIDKARKYIANSLNKIVKNKFKYYINAGLMIGNNRENKNYFSISTTNNLDHISPDGYKIALSSQERFKNPDDLKAINSLVDGLKEDVGADIPQELLNYIKKDKSIEWLKASGLKVNRNGNVLEFRFGDKITVNIYHLLYAWFYGKRYMNDIGCDEIIIDVPYVLELTTDLQEKRFRKEWWASGCTVNIEKLVINGLKWNDLLRVLKTMNVKECDMTRLGGLSNATKQLFSINQSDYDNLKTELTSRTHDISYFGQRLVLNRK